MRSALLISFAILSTPALAGEPASVAAKDPNKVVCRKDMTATGTMMRKRVCHTNAEWAQIEEQSKADLERHRDSMKMNDTVGMAR